MWRMFSNINLFFPLTLPNGDKRVFVEYEALIFQLEYHLLCCMWRMFANIYLYLPLILSNGVTRHVVEYGKLRFPPEIICNAVCEECFANMYLYLPLILSNGVKRHVVEYDELRFQPEFICNAVWRMFANIYLYLPLFSQMVSNDMLLSMINSDFSQKSFVMLCTKNVCKYLFIFTHYFIKWCHTTCCWVW